MSDSCIVLEEQYTRDNKIYAKSNKILILLIMILLCLMQKTQCPITNVAVVQLVKMSSSPRRLHAMNKKR